MIRKEKTMKLVFLIVLLFFVRATAGDSAALMAERSAWRAKLKQHTVTFDKDALSAMKSSDPVVRSYAVLKYFEKYGDRSAESLMAMAPDPDYRVASTVFGCAKAIKNHDLRIKVLTKIADAGKVMEFKRLATSLTTFTFFRNTMRLKDNPTHDHEIELIKSIPLPLAGWKFKIDPMSDGHKRKFYEIAFDDSLWKNFKIGIEWEAQGYKGYDGIAWYRLKFKMPEKMDHNAVELHFEAVDECAWVWLNGIYVGQHDLGPNGWKTPFWIDVTKEIKWGQENVIAVRIQDTARDGGIWKPVYVEILK